LSQKASNRLSIVVIIVTRVQTKRRF